MTRRCPLDQNSRPPGSAVDLTGTLYLSEPDYAQPPWALPEPLHERLYRRLRAIYPEPLARPAMAELERLLQVHMAHKPAELSAREQGFAPADRFTERDVMLITYGDLLHRPHQSPLKTLGDFCDDYLRGAINTLHILPFFPSSSDRGFSVIDFESVDPALGSWRDIAELEARYQLMFDGVINHVSSKSRWFTEFLNGNPEYEDFFRWFESEERLTPEQRRLLFRPRTTPILTRFETLRGPRYVWTTFSADQIDLNYHNPGVLLRVIEILLFYVRRGADMLRLDAVTYLWDQPGTPSIHLEQTHEIVKILRDVLSAVSPCVALVTETNVPHAENIAYFGDGSDEAHMVYNFALPPLVLHTFVSGNATALSAWAGGLRSPSRTTTFLNFLDSHDGIGLLGAQDILTREDIDRLVAHTLEHGGLVSYKTAGDEDPAPYELNITWYSALNRKEGNEPQGLKIRRFLASRAVALVLAGVPGIYLHSLFGTHNDHAAVQTGHENRMINRTVVDARSILRSMNHPRAKKYRINQGLGKMIQVRTAHPAFHPQGAQEVLSLCPEVFAVLRTSPTGDRHVLALINVTQGRRRVRVPIEETGRTEDSWVDLLSERSFAADSGGIDLRLQPYEVVWLAPHIDHNLSMLTR